MNCEGTDMKRQPLNDSSWKNEHWYCNLNDQRKYVADLIHKCHRYFSNHDKKFRIIVYILKLTILFLSMMSTVVLGIKVCFSDEVRISIGLVISALTTFFTAIYSYFHYEEYWMRNISIHIELNILRDEFIFEAEANKLDEERLSYYLQRLKELQQSNIDYWANARRLLDKKFKDE